MKIKISNIISLIFIVISVLLVISNIFELFALIEEYNRLKDFPNASGVDWLAFAIGMGIILLNSIVIMTLSIISCLTGKKRLLKTSSSVLFIIGALSFLAVIIYRMR